MLTLAMVAALVTVVATPPPTSHVAGLDWYTNLDDAKAAAHIAHKPIVSLRLLGDLNDELSCANSRFFKALLYPDPAVAKVLRERFVLHWQKVRPVPVVTIDMGDGRSFKTTLTGNSVHLVLDENGRPLDAIPGMMSPAAFLKDLDAAAAIARCPDALCVARAHQRALDALDVAWRQDMNALGRTDSPAATVVALNEDAGAVSTRALSKGIVEVPLLQRLDGSGAESAPDPGVYRSIGALHQRDVRFDDSAWARFVDGRSRAYRSRMLEEVAADTAQNEQQHHRAIHAWFVAGAPAILSERALQQRIYNEVFATPDDDPWLGLAFVKDGAPR